MSVSENKLGRAAAARRHRVSVLILRVFTSSYEPQMEDVDESKKKQGVRKVNAELLKKLQELETDIVFSTGWFFFSTL